MLIDNGWVVYDGRRVVGSAKAFSAADVELLYRWLGKSGYV